VTSFSTGRQAENTAVEYLQTIGYAILAQNWRTRWCEIDIVAQKAKTVYFVEVKYRQSNQQGSGLEYVTRRKLQQMRFAAAFWVQDHNWSGDYSLGAIEVAGLTFDVTNFLPNCT
jgi:uncharacterized protein (TIGR00252 family)